MDDLLYIDLSVDELLVDQSTVDDQHRGMSRLHVKINISLTQTTKTEKRSVLVHAGTLLLCTTPIQQHLGTVLTGIQYTWYIYTEYELIRVIMLIRMMLTFLGSAVMGLLRRVGPAFGGG